MANLIGPRSTWHNAVTLSVEYVLTTCLLKMNGNSFSYSELEGSVVPTLMSCILLNPKVFFSVNHANI